jgi:hypothetical protein
MLLAEDLVEQRAAFIVLQFQEVKSRRTGFSINRTGVALEDI